ACAAARILLIGMTHLPESVAKRHFTPCAPRMLNSRPHQSSASAKNFAPREGSEIFYVGKKVLWHNNGLKFASGTLAAT
ncbi:MAG: hypothetical protein WCB36_08905, partial [Burkholderiales bacterium]